MSSQAIPAPTTTRRWARRPSASSTAPIASASSGYSMKIAMAPRSRSTARLPRLLLDRDHVGLHLAVDRVAPEPPPNRLGRPSGR